MDRATILDCYTNAQTDALIDHPIGSLPEDEREALCHEAGLYAVAALIGASSLREAARAMNADHGPDTGCACDGCKRDRAEMNCP